MTIKNMFEKLLHEVHMLRTELRATNEALVALVDVMKRTSEVQGPIKREPLKLYCCHCGNYFENGTYHYCN